MKGSLGNGLGGSFCVCRRLVEKYFNGRKKRMSVIVDVYSSKLKISMVED